MDRVRGPADDGLKAGAVAVTRVDGEPWKVQTDIDKRVEGVTARGEGVEKIAVAGAARWGSVPARAAIRWRAVAVSTVARMIRTSAWAVSGSR
ncbi:hypothetical protein [Parafrankia sp. EUN1f]|uniref:hypothetical protein n=1 Tax=Parafrankia sp. EUN1f TaxID=102897 RepID=UPI0001C46348|nr:hypothetical protein [Parafrankia sp. EUN1f]EFC81484.1 hypothetical protein FrEUN1fDRAFT_5371 [Parafrankia sp. EUN1f]